MKQSSIALCLLFAQTFVGVAETGGERAPQPRQVVASGKAPRAWLGLRLEKPDVTVTAHLPSLPPGIGFLVKTIDQGGPAVEAGLRELDILWKLGDQMLVNEAQLAALLRLSKPGDEVVLSGFRAGKPFESKLKLGEVPALQEPVAGSMVEAAIMPGTCDWPVRLVNVAEKSASFSSEEGKAFVWREGDTFRVKIQGPKGDAIYEGDLSEDGTAPNLPENWSRRTRILCKTLKQTLDGNVIPTRQPRPRVISSSPPP